MIQSEATWPPGDGAMARRVRAHDWAGTPLGPIAGWPASLRVAVGLVLDDTEPSALLWGDALVLIHNDAWRRRAGGREAMLGRPVHEGLPAIPNEAAPPYARVLQGEAIVARNWFEPILPGGDGRHGGSLRCLPVREPDGRVAGMLCTMIDAVRRSDARLRRDEAWFDVQKEAFQIAMDGGGLAAALAPLIRAASGTTDGRRCAFYIADADGGGLRHVVGMSPAYAAAVDGFQVSPESLACGLAVATGQPVITPDVLEDPRWQPWTWLAHEHDYRACWSFPVETASGRLVGSFAVYFREPRDASRADRSRAATITSTAAIIISHHQQNMHRLQSKERLRQFGEASQDVLWIRDVDTLQWQYLTPAFEAVYGLERGAALTGDNYRNWLDLVVPEDRPQAMAAIARVGRGEHVTFDYRVRRPIDGTVRWLRDTDFPIADADGRIRLIGGIGHDLTEHLETEQRLQTLMEGIPQLVWRAVTGGIWTWSSPQWTAFTGLTEADSTGFGWLDALHPDDRAEAMGFWDRAVETGTLELEGRIRNAQTRDYRWFQTRAAPVRDAGGTIVEWLGTSTDIHDMHELQERQKVLVAELQHRTRNLIGVVRSMSDKTARASADLPDFRSRFRDRLDALSRVQGLLSRLNEVDDRVTFDELIRTELSALNGSAERVALHGPLGVRLRSSTVQTLAMALHELATNAVKYGALGQPAAQLAITWSLEAPDADGTPWLHIDWRESDVAMPAPGASPGGTGQGRELIEHALPYQLSARTSYRLGADGVHCTISIPVSATTMELEEDPSAEPLPSG